MCKKLFFVFVFLVSSVCSQTKQETEVYILDKLKMYSTQSNYHKKSFTLNGSELIIENISTDDRYETVKYVFPLWALQSLSLQRNGYKEGSLIFYLDKYCTSCIKYVNGSKPIYKTQYYTVYKQRYRAGFNEYETVPVEKSRRVVDYYKRYNRQENINSFTIYLKNADPEEDFIGRFQRAIDHLKTMYPKKPGSSDLFDKDKVKEKTEFKSNPSYKTDSKTSYKETYPIKDKENELDRLLVEAKKQYDAGNKTYSRKIYQQALLLDPKNESLYFVIGLISHQLKDFNAAKYNYQQALKISPNYKDANLNLAIIILEPEVEIVKKMKALGYSDADTKKYNQYVEQRKAIYREALPYLKRYWQKNKNNSEVNETLKNIYQTLGMTRELIELKNK